MGLWIPLTPHTQAMNMQFALWGEGYSGHHSQHRHREGLATKEHKSRSTQSCSHLVARAVTCNGLWVISISMHRSWTWSGLTKRKACARAVTHRVTCPIQASTFTQLWRQCKSHTQTPTFVMVYFRTIKLVVQVKFFMWQDFRKKLNLVGTAYGIMCLCCQWCWEWLTMIKMMSHAFSWWARAH